METSNREMMINLKKNKTEANRLLSEKTDSHLESTTNFRHQISSLNQTISNMQSSLLEKDSIVLQNESLHIEIEKLKEEKSAMKSLQSEATAFGSPSLKRILQPERSNDADNEKEVISKKNGQIKLLQQENLLLKEQLSCLEGQLRKKDSLVDENISLTNEVKGLNQRLE